MSSLGQAGNFQQLLHLPEPTCSPETGSEGGWNLQGQRKTMGRTSRVYPDVLVPGPPALSQVSVQRQGSAEVGSPRRVSQLGLH